MMRLPHDRAKALESAHAIAQETEFKCVVIEIEGDVYLMTEEEHKSAVRDKHSWINKKTLVRPVRVRVRIHR